MLDAKQLTLKLLANVTYGYTSASFSGRMPLVEIADSIVSTGRETLERVSLSKPTCRSAFSHLLSIRRLFD
jgi:DNA polymerase elongation subunit (family B)